MPNTSRFLHSMLSYYFQEPICNVFISYLFIIFSLFFSVDMKGKIRVYCRLRPLTEKEILDREKSMVITPDEYTIAHPWKDEKSKQHVYDRVFDPSASQEEVFEDTKVVFF